MQVAADKLFADVANLAAPGSSFLFDFLQLDALEGLTQPVGYANTAKVSVTDSSKHYWGHIKRITMLSLGLPAVCADV